MALDAKTVERLPDTVGRFDGDVRQALIRVRAWQICQIVIAGKMPRELRG